MARGNGIAEDAGATFSKGECLAPACDVQNLMAGQAEPKDLRTIFPPSTPLSLLGFLSKLLKYESSARLTSRECLEHNYFQEALPSVREDPLELPQRHTYASSPGTSTVPSSSLQMIEHIYGTPVDTDTRDRREREWEN